MLHWATVEEGGKIPSFDTVFPEPSVTTSKETVIFFMEHMMTLHTVMKASKDMDSAVVESDYVATDYNPQPPSGSVFSSLYNIRGEVQCTWADFAVVTNTNIQEIVENGPTNSINTLE